MELELEKSWCSGIQIHDLEVGQANELILFQGGWGL